jgi:hypothetical protein
MLSQANIQNPITDENIQTEWDRVNALKNRWKQERATTQKFSNLILKLDDVMNFKEIDALLTHYGLDIINTREKPLEDYQLNIRDAFKLIFLIHHNQTEEIEKLAEKNRAAFGQAITILRLDGTTSQLSPFQYARELENLAPLVTSQLTASVEPAQSTAIPKLEMDTLNNTRFDKTQMRSFLEHHNLNTPITSTKLFTNAQQQSRDAFRLIFLIHHSLLEEATNLLTVRQQGLFQTVTISDQTGEERTTTPLKYAEDRVAHDAGVARMMISFANLIQSTGKQDLIAKFDLQTSKLNREMYRSQTQEEIDFASHSY